MDPTWALTVVSRKLEKRSTESRFCVMVSNSQKPFSCLGEVMETSKKYSIAFIKKFSKLRGKS